MHNQKTNSDKGFTLVELAIVMIIIGLLIGGVLKGQQLIENAKVTAAISQIKGFQASLISFRDAYGATPGDMANADTRLSGCDSGNSNNCDAGNGDSIVGFFNAGASNPLRRVWVDAVDDFAGADAENFQYWKHLALADLITGVDPTTSTADAAWGASHPSSPFPGGYHIVHSMAATWNDNFNGLVLRMQNAMTGTPVLGHGENPLNSIQARRIDEKLDDGYAESGFVIGDDGLGGNSPCEGDYGIDTTWGSGDDSKDCVLYIKIDG